MTKKVNEINSKMVKEILADKLASEGTYFKKSDVSVRKTTNGYKIIIKGYEHIVFTIKEEIDDFFGYCLNVWETSEFFGEKSKKLIIWEDGKSGFHYIPVILRLGYIIGNTF